MSYLILFQIAKNYLTIQVILVSSKKAFLISKLTILKIKNKLDFEIIRAIIYIKN